MDVGTSRGIMWVGSSCTNQKKLHLELSPIGFLHKSETGMEAQRSLSFIKCFVSKDIDACVCVSEECSGY
jgi:hypothetical protein